MSTTFAQRPLKPIWHVIPSGWSIPFVLLGSSWVVMLGASSAALAVAEVADGKSVMAGLRMLTLMLGFAVVPIAALLLFIGALLAGRWAARAGLMAVTLVGTVFGLISLLLHATMAGDPVGDGAMTLFLYVVPCGVLVVGLIISAVMAVREVRSSISDARKQRVQDLLTARGEVSFDTLAEDLGLPAKEVRSLVHDLLKQQRIRAVVDDDARMLFSYERYGRKQWDLVSVSYGRGEVGLDELSKELKLSEGRLRELLVAAMQGGVFAGFVDWRNRKVVSADAAKLRQGRHCPSCGAQMQLAGRGLIVCSYCGAEVFLSG